MIVEYGIFRCVGAIAGRDRVGQVRDDRLHCFVWNTRCPPLAQPRPAAPADRPKFDNNSSAMRDALNAKAVVFQASAAAPRLQRALRIVAGRLRLFRSSPRGSHSPCRAVSANSAASRAARTHFAATAELGAMPNRASPSAGNTAATFSVRLCDVSLFSPSGLSAGIARCDWNSQQGCCRRL